MDFSKIQSQRLMAKLLQLASRPGFDRLPAAEQDRIFDVLLTAQLADNREGIF
jgi:hypothetical protein